MFEVAILVVWVMLICVHIVSIDRDVMIHKASREATEILIKDERDNWRELFERIEAVPFEKHLSKPVTALHLANA